MAGALRTFHCVPFLESHQVCNQFALLRVREPCLEKTVIVIDDRLERRKPPVMKEAAFYVAKKPFERRCPIHFRRRPVCLKVVNADLLRTMQIESRLCVKRRDMA